MGPHSVVKATAIDTQCHKITQKPIGRMTEHFPAIVPEFLIDFRVRPPRLAERHPRTIRRAFKHISAKFFLQPDRC